MYTDSLDSYLAPLNPFFVYQNDELTGIWSLEIIDEMNRVRPQARWAEINHSFGSIEYSKDGKMVVKPEKPGKKITSLPLAQYRTLSLGEHRMTIT